MIEAPVVTTITFLASNLELAEKELAKAQEEMTRWQKVVDSLRHARSEVQSKSSYMRPPKKNETVVAWYKAKGQEAHVRDIARDMHMSDREAHNMAVQKRVFYKSKKAANTYGLLEWQR